MKMIRALTQIFGRTIELELFEGEIEDRNLGERFKNEIRISEVIWNKNFEGLIFGITKKDQRRDLN